MPYIRQKSGVWIFKSEGLPMEPDIEAFLSDDHARQHMESFERDGYELVSAQPVLKAVVQQSQEHGPSPWGFGYPVTAGFVLFWKR